MSAAKRGDPHALKRLRGPAVSRRVLYLLELYFEYAEFRRVEAGPHGLIEVPADWNALSRFTEMTGRALTRHERHVFRRIDNAYFAAKHAGNGGSAGEA